MLLASLRAALGACLLAAAIPAHALPMGTPGDWMVMADLGADERELAANRATSQTWAWGLAQGRWEEMHGGLHERSRDYGVATVTHRVQRWNLPHAQANVWLVGMLGRVRGDGVEGSRTLRGLSLMADYETTRVYLGSGWRPMRAGQGLRHDSTWLRSGFSFYEAEYDAIQPWFIVEAKQVRTRFARETSVTPMLRFIHKRVFVEAGANRKGGQLNVMFVF